jgi:uncharacterized protein YndB with AHSA1/START domain
MPTIAVTVRRVIKASPSEVWRCWTRPPVLRGWFSDTAVMDTPNKGGRVYFGWSSGYYAVGEVLASIPERKLSITWQGRGYPAPTRADISLRAVGRSTAVTVTQRDIGRGKGWVGVVDAVRAGWEEALENLQSVLETGDDLRFTRRPMLGIQFTVLEPDRATALGLPVKGGFHVDGVVPGMGAEAAGLRAGDVVISIGGAKTDRWAVVGVALGRHTAGDTVPVVFYRGSAKHTLPMTLSARPLPPLPSDPARLAAEVRAIQAREQAGLAECFAGVSEAQANRRPAEREWSANEILAHLLIWERALGDLASVALIDGALWWETLDNEFDARPSGLVEAHGGSSRALLEQIHLAQAETAATVAAIPPAILAQKRIAWQLGQLLLQPTTHIESHYSQIRAALGT